MSGKLTHNLPHQTAKSWGTSNEITSRGRSLPTFNPIPQLDLLIDEGREGGHIPFPFLGNTVSSSLTMPVELTVSKRGGTPTLFSKTHN